ncbi:gliding motility-associated C-terminal domain-containing protein [Flavobacterium sp. W20_MBD1_R3]|uniref:T9SS type B sorting domain-containing protein n=1 Tax=Flavobacterium sp. W20_MBD1_R3 TaxID=3240278 RepID=UPI003F8F7F9E
MRKKILLFLLFHSLFSFSSRAENLNINVVVHDFDLKLISCSISLETNINRIKKINYLQNLKAVVALPPPNTIAGSTCGDGLNSVQVNISAFGSNGTETIEWYTSQTAGIPIYTGNVYSPNINTTRTYYVQSRLGADVSIRVPVVASVYVIPPDVTLAVSPAHYGSLTLCLGTAVTFTATGGGDLFEFSVDGVVKQSMSTNKVFVTNTLTDGQVVRVRTRYAVSFDGNVTEKAWGTGSLEDNFLSAPLSAGASTGYINSLKISPTEDKLTFGVLGKVLSNRRILVFLDTKAGGFNVTDYGDENGTIPLVNAFNFFNNTLSFFDSYFQADYCLAIGTDLGESNYTADLIELKTGTSIKTNISTVATGSPSSVMGVNKNNTGINDYSLGFEVEILKSLIGYTTGDIKFFAMTMADQDETNYLVTNSFLSPERTSNLDYGNGAIDFNVKDSNPVVVASSALTPCYAEANITMSFVENPSIATVGGNQSKCILTSDSLGGNTPAVGTGSWSKKSGPGDVTFSDITNGSSTATVNAEGIYVFTWTISNGQCTPSTADITVDYKITLPPVVVSITQPTCADNSGSVVLNDLPSVGNWTITPSIGSPVTGSGSSYEFSNLTASTTYTFTVTGLNNCPSVPSAAVTINAIPLPPVVPATASVVQPTCAIPSGGISITAQSGVEYSLDGTTYQSSNTFSGLAPNNYTLYVRNTADNTCVTPSSSVITINAVPLPPIVPITASVVQPTCATPSGSISIATQTGVEYSLDGTTYQSSNTFSGLAPNNYTLYVRNTADNTCVTPSSSLITINAVPLPPVVPTTASVVQPTCATPSGSISITKQSGVEYSLDGTTYQSSNTFSGLTSNNYTMYVRNTADNTCVTPSSSVITINAVPLPPVVPTTASVVQPTCAIPSGSISITTQSGVEYSLDGTTYQSSNTFSGLAPNNYTLYARNTADNTCVTPSSSVIIINAVPLPPVVPTTANVVQPTCAIPSGSISITTQTGVEYSLDGTTYQSSNTFSGLAPNNYTLYVRNTADNTCVTPSSLVITINAIPLPPVVPTTASVVQPTCATPSGSISIATQSGVEYSLDGTTYKSSNAFSGLAPNNYTLYVRNTADNTCVTPSSAAITINAVPLPPIVPTTASVVQPTCAIPSGSISITTQSGVEYSLDGTTYQSSNTFSGLTPNNYTLYVRNTADNTCVTPSSSVITINAIPLPPVVPTTASVVQPTCAIPSGSISITTQSGVEYSLDGTTYQSSNTFSGLAPNNYTLYVRNTADNTCVTPSLSVITINAVPLPPIVPTTASVVQPTCATPSGSISITTQSGVEYSLDGTTYQSSNTFSGLAPNNYTWYVRNTADNTCVTPSSAVITINAISLPPIVPTTASVVQPTCATPSGSISITTQSGVEYSLDGTTYQSSNTFSGLAPNNYTLYVRNTADNTCVTPSSAAITINAVPLPPIVPTTVSVVQPTCATPSGSISITTQSGVEYSLDGTTYQSSNTFSGLPPNNYTLYVRNTVDNTCAAQSVSTITIKAIPLPPVVPTTVSVVQPTCATPSGSISISTQSGVEYSLDGTTYQSSNIFSGLAPNTYTLYVRNTADNTCVTPSSVAITINAIPLPPIVPTTASVVQPTCAIPSGSISITTQSGVEYSLDGTTYQSSNTFSGLVPNNYTLYVRNTADNTCVTPSSAAITINAIPLPPIVPTTASVVQPTCATPSGSIAITTQLGVEYSLNGVTYQSSNTFSGLVPNNYTLYVRNTVDNTCAAQSVSVIIINAIPLLPVVPTATTVIQPTCAIPSGTITIVAQSGVEYSLNGSTYQTSNTFSGLAPNNYLLYVRNIADNTCSVISMAGVTVNPLPLLPSTPTLVQVTQPTCLVRSGSITISTQADVQYSIGSGYQNSPVFNNLASGKYIMSVRFTASIACITVGSEITINAIPPQIQFETIGDCENKEYILTANPMSSSYDSNEVSYQWKDKDGNLVGTNSNVLNVTDVIASTPTGEIVFPAVYSLTVTSVATGCETSANVIVESAYCNIQKGISPDGNGSNDFFDLSLMDVKKLEIFNRYGIKVYSQQNYTDQWKGQSNKGEDLPGATYYYVIEFNSGEPKTGWIYLIREKQ